LIADGLLKRTIEPRCLRAAMKPKPVVPKRPMSGYILFAYEQRQAIRAAHPDWNIIAVAKQLGADWKALSEEQRTDFKARKVQNVKDTTVKPVTKKRKLEKLTVSDPSAEAPINVKHTSEPTPEPTSDETTTQSNAEPDVPQTQIEDVHEIPINGTKSDTQTEQEEIATKQDGK
jgi:hypothetical protein